MDEDVVTILLSMAHRIFLQNNSHRRFQVVPTASGDGVPNGIIDSGENSEIQSSLGVTSFSLRFKEDTIELKTPNASTMDPIIWRAGELEFTVHAHLHRTEGQTRLTFTLNETTPVPAEDVNTFSVLTYNTWLRPRILPKGQDERTRLMPALLRGYDVIVLNEVFIAALASQLVSDLRDEYPYQTDVLGSCSLPRPFGRGLKLVNGGVMVMSRWPIETTDSVLFSAYLGPPDNLSDKGVQYVRINRRGQTVHIFALHSHAAPEDLIVKLYGWVGRNADQEFYQHRQEHWNLIRAWIADLDIPATEPVLIAGDFNTDCFHEPERYSDMLTRLQASCPPSQGHKYTFDPATNPLCVGDRKQMLDYVLYSNKHLTPLESSLDVRLMRTVVPWSPKRGGETFWDLSDHYGVVGRFLFPSTTERQGD